VDGERRQEGGLTLPQVNINGRLVEMSDTEYGTYMRNFANQGYAQGINPNDDPSGMGTYGGIGGIGSMGNIVDNRPETQRTLRDYYYDPASGGGSRLARTGVQMVGGAILGAATGGAGYVVGPAAGIGMGYMNNMADAGGNPQSYREMTPGGRKVYLTDYLTTGDRAKNLTNPTESETYQEDPRLLKYLSRVDPYEEMAYYNPKNRDPSGKERAWGLKEWARQRIQQRWRSDMDAMEGQELASKYELEMPESLKNRGPFSANVSRY
jgi:hypothetical protein